MRSVSQYGVPIILIFGDPCIDMARAKIVHDFLASGADCLLFVDNDIVFQAEDCFRIVQDACRMQAVIGAPYAQKAKGGRMVGSFAPYIKEAGFFASGELYPTGDVGVGMGFTAIPRFVFEKLADSLPSVTCDGRRMKPFFAPLLEEGKAYHSEDFSFCKRVKEAGIPVLLDTRICLGHRGPYTYTIADCGVSSNTPTDLRVRLEQ